MVVIGALLQSLHRTVTERRERIWGFCMMSDDIESTLDWGSEATSEKGNSA
jgi:hypothetical protein